MSAAYVSGVAALVMASNGNALSPYQVVRQIKEHRRRRGARRRDLASGYGGQLPGGGHADGARRRRIRGQRRRQVADQLAAPGPARSARDGRGHRPLRRGLRRRLRADDAARRAGEDQAHYRRGVADLYLWRPGTTTVGTQRPTYRRNLIRYIGGVSKRKTIVYQAKKNGRHFVNVPARRGNTDYTVTLERLRPR